MTQPKNMPNLGPEYIAPFERDPDEPVAHIVRELDALVKARGAKPWDDMLNVALRALEHALTYAIANNMDDARLRVGHIHDMIEALPDQD